jgi:hypothetical protein
MKEVQHAIKIACALNTWLASDDASLWWVQKTAKTSLIDSWTLSFTQNVAIRQCVAAIKHHCLHDFFYISNLIASRNYKP